MIYIWKDTGDAATWRFFIITPHRDVIRLDQDAWNNAFAATVGQKVSVTLNADELEPYAAQFPTAKRALLLAP